TSWPVLKTMTSAVSATVITMIAIRSSIIRKPSSLRMRATVRVSAAATPGSSGRMALMSAGTPFVALLRGVNVGGRAKVPMAELRSSLAALGFEDVVTYIQSGNIVFRAPKGTADELAA